MLAVLNGASPDDPTIQGVVKDKLPKFVTNEYHPSTRRSSTKPASTRRHPTMQRDGESRSTRSWIGTPVDIGTILLFISYHDHGDTSISQYAAGDLGKPNGPAFTSEQCVGQDRQLAVLDHDEAFGTIRGQPRSDQLDRGRGHRRMRRHGRYELPAESVKAKGEIWRFDEV